MKISGGRWGTGGGVSGRGSRGGGGGGLGRGPSMGPLYTGGRGWFLGRGGGSRGGMAGGLSDLELS